MGEVLHACEISCTDISDGGGSHEPMLGDAFGARSLRSRRNLPEARLPHALRAYAERASYPRLVVLNFVEQSRDEVFNVPFGLDGVNGPREQVSLCPPEVVGGVT